MTLRVAVLVTEHATNAAHHFIVVLLSGLFFWCIIFYISCRLRELVINSVYALSKQTNKTTAHATAKGMYVL